MRYSVWIAFPIIQYVMAMLSFKHLHPGGYIQLYTQIELNDPSNSRRVSYG